jgi:hypothetical protein
VQYDFLHLRFHQKEDFHLFGGQVAEDLPFGGLELIGDQLDEEGELVHLVLQEFDGDHLAVGGFLIVRLCMTGNLCHYPHQEIKH